MNEVPPVRCRVCGSDRVHALGVVEYFAGYPWQVSDCLQCGCRFTRHDESVHEVFHQSGAISYYAQYRDLAEQTGRLFAAHDLAGLRRYLVGTAAKYQFVIEAAERLAPNASCLEVGCSRGYLSSWLILAGLDVLGVDISAEAVSAATASFGEHFALAGSARAEAGGPYDLIYHVGVIGCVADPIGLTRMLMAKLKPGGRLIFNAPNRDACVLRDQWWIDSAPPPDLVTLFPPGFWRQQFSDIADVEEIVQYRSPDENTRSWVARLSGRKWQKPQPQPLQSSPGTHRIWLQPVTRGGQLLERAVSKIGRLTGLSKCAPPVASEFGLFVTLTRRA